MKPFVSIIIPTFNAAAKLEASLRSVVELQAPFEDLEVLILDGASVDETAQIARELAIVDKRIRVWSEPDKGIYDAMNRGIERSRGRFLYFLGAGDTLREGVLERVARLVDEAPTDLPLLVYGDIWWNDLGFEAGGPFNQWRITTTCPCHQTMFTAREVFQLKGNFDLKYPIAADYAWHIRCFGDTRIHKIHLPLVIANYEGGGLSARTRDDAFAADLPALVDRHFSAPVRWLYCLRRASPARLKRWGAPILGRLGWMPDKRIFEPRPPKSDSPPHL